MSQPRVLGFARLALAAGQAALVIERAGFMAGGRGKKLVKVHHTGVESKGEGGTITG